MLVLDMIEIIPLLRKYKYDNWKIFPMKCYIDNFIHLRSYIRNINSTEIGKQKTNGLLSLTTMKTLLGR
jgi:hypothetical protein